MLTYIVFFFFLGTDFQFVCRCHLPLNDGTKGADLAVTGGGDQNLFSRRKMGESGAFFLLLLVYNPLAMSGSVI